MRASFLSLERQIAAKPMTKYAFTRTLIIGPGSEGRDIVVALLRLPNDLAIAVRMRRVQYQTSGPAAKNPAAQTRRSGRRMGLRFREGSSCWRCGFPIS